MKEKIALLWAKKILNGERTLAEVPRGLLVAVKKAIANQVK
jgi:hypothetical protein